MIRVAFALIRLLPEMAERGRAESYGRTTALTHAQVSQSGEPGPALLHHKSTLPIASPPWPPPVPVPFRFVPFRPLRTPSHVIPTPAMRLLIDAWVADENAFDPLALVSAAQPNLEYRRQLGGMLLHLGDVIQPSSSNATDHALLELIAGEKYLRPDPKRATQLLNKIIRDEDLCSGAPLVGDTRQQQLPCHPRLRHKLRWLRSIMHCKQGSFDLGRRDLDEAVAINVRGGGGGDQLDSARHGRMMLNVAELPRFGEQGDNLPATRPKPLATHRAPRATRRAPTSSFVLQIPRRWQRAQRPD